MDSDYDRKFEEMKKYIPFLESMIKRLANSNMPSNPRQAQLDKIKSLRDLLLDKKKRMKMENLLKCEQVLVNLYKKVEQGPTLDTKSDSEVPSAKISNLNEVRNKLKSVSSKLSEDTLPEIARASDTEEVWDPGSKEPALFQRRPNRVTISPTKPETPTKNDETPPQTSKKNYTRVLVSPDRSNRRWSENEDSKPEKPLFSRRSPRKQPSDVSLPLQYKKERKKEKKEKSKQSRSNDLNITLKVPEESLSSLSTDDILSRIINCNDNDVDIATLRTLRSQILGELKDTGVKEDISDLLLKSYTKNKNKRDTEIEEGELSDSESETIESIYGNLVVMDKDKTQSTIKASLGKDKSRKIQICLVINSDKITPTDNVDNKPKRGKVDETDFESFPTDNKSKIDEKISNSSTLEDKKEKTNKSESTKQNNNLVDENLIKDKQNNDTAPDNEKIIDTPISYDKHPPNSAAVVTMKNNENKTVEDETKNSLDNETIKSKISNKSNVSLVHCETSSDISMSHLKESSVEYPQKTTNIEESQTGSKKQDSVEIPFLNQEAKTKPETVSEIEILQALKKEILGEGPAIADAEIETPLLHQPKLTKVASAQEIVKKRISIENYKQKSHPSPQHLFFKNVKDTTHKEDKNKKQSLKLTEKECERFNLPIKLPLDESSEDEFVEDCSLSLKKIYNESAPKSPDHDDFADMGIKPPVIIPSDPVKPQEVILPADIDMRLLNSGVNSLFAKNATTPVCPKNNTADLNIENEKPKVPLLDPRKIRREDSLSQDSSFLSTENVPIQNINDTIHNQGQPSIMGSSSMPSNTLPTLPNMTPLRTPNITPISIPNATPNARSFEMTPSRHPFDGDNYQEKKHIYAPILPNHAFDNYDTPAEYNQWDSNNDNSRPWEDNHRQPLPSRDVDYRRFNHDGYQNDPRQEMVNERDSYNRMECPQTPINLFGRQDCPATPLPSFGRLECPATPLPSFGRLECPTTPLPSFGRFEGQAPMSSYGRMECPSTPLPSFGRLDCPSTPLPSFGRQEMPMTPVHPFGRSDGSATPVHSYGRSDCGQIFGPPNNSTFGRNTDPRINIDNYNRWEDDRDYRYYRDRHFNSSFTSDTPPYYPSDSYRNFETNFGKEDMYRSRKHRNERQYKDYRNDREYRGRSQNRDNENRNRNSRDNRRSGYMDSDNFKYSDYKRNNYQREKSVNREKSVERKYSDSHRASSSNRIANKVNKMKEVKQSVERSFNIDTSVSSSFQKFKNDNLNFNSRRQRAASVGRTFSNNSSDRNIKNDNKSETQKSEYSHRRRSFSRARSVGREVDSQNGSNLKDVKAELRSFQYKNNTNATKIVDSSKMIKIDKSKAPSSMERQNSQSNFGDKYSPRKNLRDPRMRRESRWDDIEKNNQSCARDSKGYGIVYSDDNISKGKILGSASGVRNYKIPKIKRSPEKPVTSEEPKEDGKNQDTEKEEQDSEKLKIKKDVTDNAANKSTLKIESEDKKQASAIEVESDIIISSPKINSTIEHNVLKNIDKADDITSPNRRITRSAKVSLSIEPLPDSPVRRSRKCKKPVIYDSESDAEEKCIAKDALKNTNDAVSSLKIDDENESLVSFSKVKSPQNDKNSNDDLNSSFGDIFSDNISCDPVLDNINALIADLDHDLDSSKAMTQNQFTQEISLENMLENITTSEPLQIDQTPVVNIFSNQELPGQLDDNSTQGKDAQILDCKTSSECLQEEIKEKNNECNVASLNMSSSKNTSKIDIDKSEAVVSTSKDETQKSIHEESLEKQVILNECNDPTKLTAPDSTITITNLTNQENIPDSTNESSNDITSSISDVSGKDPIKTSDSTDQGDSIGQLLSILQDKSKIKELLTLLEKNSSDNEKIKKKLEKLSEIVSDDEDGDSEDKGTKTTKNQIDDTESLSVTNTSDNKLQTPSLEDVVTETEIPILNSEPTPENKLDSTDKSATSIITEKEALPSNTLNQESINDSLQIEQTVENSDKIEDEQDTTQIPKKGIKGKYRRKGFKKGPIKNKKPVTRSVVATKPKEKKPSRELLKLQADIKEMFIKDDILASTSGIRSCRLAKYVDENSQSSKDEVQKDDFESVVRPENFKNINKLDSNSTTKKITKKNNTKGKTLVIEGKVTTETLQSGSTQNSSISSDDDPYLFETDSGESISKFHPRVQNPLVQKRGDSGSDYDSDSAVSSRSGSTELSTVLCTELKKKPRRQRRAWQAGVIVPKSRKKKNQTLSISTNTSTDPITEDKSIISDPIGFTDKVYCFLKNTTIYECRLCDYNGSNIVNHYKKQHPHVEIPLSRMSPDVAKEAIKQCDKVNLQSISKLPSDSYVCRFCFKKFSNQTNLLESFFWHIVSDHTGEYKQTCPVCVNDAQCPFDLDVPPPPVAQKGQIIGYICGLCNYTQVSLENLKNHVVTRHNDKQTEVFTINMSHMSTKAVNILLKRLQNLSNMKDSEDRRVLRRTRNNIGPEPSEKLEFADDSDTSASVCSLQDINKVKEPQPLRIHAKIAFENDSDTEKSLQRTESIISNVKLEPQSYDGENDLESQPNSELNEASSERKESSVESSKNLVETKSNTDLFELPHFKVNFTDAGSKEYVCCINNNNHYKSTLLISFKKHVQMKHSEKWDGYCCLCKVIVTPVGIHSFFNCLQHFLEKHFDDFPVLEKDVSEPAVAPLNDQANERETSTPKPFLSLRPLSELISLAVDASYPTNPSPLPIIESVVSLGTEPCESPVIHQSTEVIQSHQKQYLYEDAQVKFCSQKNAIVLDAMMKHEKLINVFKCAGRFCSFTTDSASDALLHASTHSRVGGENALKCAYCDFDSLDNAIDLITHVFKIHGACQFACGACFYRAAASQLVNAHITRMHPDKAATILKAPFVTVESCESTILPRTDAVPYYICTHEDEQGESCKFKTYILRKFSEHLETKHFNATDHKCFICQEIFKDSYLLNHLKSHGLKLYQCVWCVFGADNENELLAHASAKHPSKQPQAYLRVITNKKGTSEFRVLPLAHLNKSNIPYVDIQSNVKENPVREAERSVDLEKLIGNTTLFIDSMATAVTETSDQNKIVDSPGLADQKATVTPTLALETRAVTPVAPITLDEEITPILKKDTADITPKKTFLNTSDIISLDSDDEDVNSSGAIDQGAPSAPAGQAPPSTPAGQAAPSTSGTNKTNEPVKLNKNLLYMCSKCTTIAKSKIIFKSHLNSCFSGINDIPCAYCSFKGTKQKILNHYTSEHLANTVLFICSKCPEKFPTLMQAKEHAKLAHNMTIHETSLKYVNGQRFLIVNDAVKPTVRRKRSLGSNDKTEEPPTKITKFGPQDVDRLPINPIFDYSVNCSLCEFSTKVRLNMVRHLQLHANQQPVPQTAPVNPVPHLETNEKHFDKMVNLASSSLTVRAQDKSKSENPVVTVLVTPDEAARFPKYVPERQRLTCGAKGCLYISVDENMLKYHWETLHSDTKDFHCVHCPPSQTLDTTYALTASRIIAHLKMHDVRLYACTQCTYYHYRRQVVEKHLNEVHQGGDIMIVREENSSPQVPVAPVASAPTMDLKPWQCGLCEFKSLLRPEVVEHCSTAHQSKMQFRCAYCAFRTSNAENVTKHQSLSHQGKPEELFYYFYREGSLPNLDGVPYWQAQRLKFNITEARVKTEVSDSGTAKINTQESKSLTPNVDLNIVKQEAPEVEEESVENLCKQFGEFCEPNGLKYKCSLCKNVIEDTKEAMQSHLYEELQYRKWGCSICFYKAFHKRGLSEHMLAEHCQNRDPVELAVDVKVETWVAKLLEHQELIIEKNKEKLAQQKIEILRQAPSTSQVLPAQSSPKPLAQKTDEDMGKASTEELVKKFGSFGSAVDMAFCCPKCNDMIKEESSMRDHLESELNKIRWCCSACPQTFQTYHQSQFHCKTHTGISARPLEAPREFAFRTAWVDAVIKSQLSTINRDSTPEAENKPKQDTALPQETDNSLLVVRYEKRVPTPEVVVPTGADPNSEDEKLVIDESLKTRKRRAQVTRCCSYCNFTTTSDKFLKAHLLRHYGLLAYSCGYCKLTGCKNTIIQHQRSYHANQPLKVLDTEVPQEDPEVWNKRNQNLASDHNLRLICLTCQLPVDKEDILSHLHSGIQSEFGKAGDLVIKCSSCSSLHKNIAQFVAHDKAAHSSAGLYVFHKLTQQTIYSLRFICVHCPQRFNLKKDLQAHVSAMHPLSETATEPKEIICVDDEIVQAETTPPVRKVARKSTTKLPNRAVAKKSTTKLPYPQEYSFYGTKPCTDNLENITTLMPVYNKLVEFPYKKLQETFNIQPIVLVEKCSNVI